MQDRNLQSLAWQHAIVHVYFTPHYFVVNYAFQNYCSSYSDDEFNACRL